MIIYVRVKPNCSEQKVVKFDTNRFLIYLESSAENNEANIELVKMLSKHYGVPFKNIKFKSGLTSRDKILEIL